MRAASLLPFLPTLQSCTRQDLRADFTAAFTVTRMATPKAMAYAMMAGVAVYVIEGSLFFGAIHELERQLNEEDKEPARLVVVHLTRVFWLDASGAHALEQFVERCYARSLPVILVAGSRNVRDILRRTGNLSYLSAGFVAQTMDEGLQLASNLLQRITCRGDVCDLPPAAQSREAVSGPSPNQR